MTAIVTMLFFDNEGVVYLEEQERIEMLNMPRIRQSHSDGMYFYKNFETGFCYIENNPYLPDQMKHTSQDLLQDLYSGMWICKEDHDKIVNLYERMEQGRQEPIYMDELSVNIQLQMNAHTPRLYSLVCYLDTNENGCIRSYVGKLCAMREQEIQNLRILQTFTNDKNPVVFLSRIEEFLAKAPERDYAFIQFDIRRFHYINEIHGSSVGDQILQYVLDTLAVMCDRNHIFCRMSADLFEVVTPYTSKEDILSFIEQLDARLHGWNSISFSMSYGVAIVPGTTTQYRTSGDLAGFARNYIKNSVMKKVAFYDEIPKDIHKQTALIEALEEDALANQEFHVFLQPKYHYNKQRSEIVGAEALVRWIPKNQQIIPPNSFIPVFEKNGFILKLDQFMWESVCKLLRKWIDKGFQPVPISINVSRTYLGKNDIVEYLTSLIRQYDIPIHLLQIEITETAENDETIRCANAFKEAGFTLMMDDFGSGFSSLSMLKNTPFDVLKMDRFFLDTCFENKNGQTIVSHVISMSNDLGLDVVAEGVETKEQADFLFDHGCPVSQGYYFSKPVPVEEFEVLWNPTAHD